MKLLIIGATGPTGRELVRQAIARGDQVTALVRNATKAGFASPVEMIEGDVLDLASLKVAAAGQDAAISALGSAASGPFKAETLLSTGTRNLVAAMRAAKVSRLISITGVGAGDSKGHGPWYYNWLIQPLVLRGVYQDKTRQEDIVRASELDWTLVRPSLLTHGTAKGSAAVRAITSLDGVHVSTISRADVAAFCLQELTDRRFLRQAPVITN